jgi:hypothetical protein
MPGDFQAFDFQNLQALGSSGIARGTEGGHGHRPDARIAGILAKFSVFRLF